MVEIIVRWRVDVDGRMAWRSCQHRTMGASGSIYVTTLPYLLFALTGGTNVPGWPLPGSQGLNAWAIFSLHNPFLEGIEQVVRLRKVLSHYICINKNKNVS